MPTKKKDKKDAKPAEKKSAEKKTPKKSEKKSEKKEQKEKGEKWWVLVHVQEEEHDYVKEPLQYLVHHLRFSLFQRVSRKLQAMYWQDLFYSWKVSQYKNGKFAESASFVWFHHCSLILDLNISSKFL